MRRESGSVPRMKRRAPPYPGLPPCPAPDTSELRHEARSDAPLRIPKAFRPESSSYMHGGKRFRNGDTLIEVVNGHYGWSSFTGQYGGGGVMPAGCVARLGGRIYMVSESRDSTRFYASAVPVSDTVQVYGDRRFGISAPHSVRGWLLGLLRLRAPAPQFAAPWIRFHGNPHLVVTAFDSSRLRWRADTADVWLRSQYDEPLRIPNDSTLPVAGMDRHLLVHCASLTAREMRMLVRDAAGDSVHGTTHPGPQYVPYLEPVFGTLLTDLCTVLPGGPRSR